VVALFNRDFDNEADIDVECSTDSRTYTQAELQNLLTIANDQAFNDGHLEGYNMGHADATQNQQSEVNSALMSIGDQLHILHQQAGSFRNQVQQQTLEFTIGVAKRILPELREVFSSAIAVQATRQTLVLALGIPKLTVRLSPNTKKFLEAEGIDLSKDAEANREIQISTDEKISDGDAVVEWENGQANYSLDKICSEVIETMETTLARLVDSKG
jgi:flagellar biosynthesis/type III secretory pathway protein FliH